MYKVWKFGGTSVGKFETLAKIVQKVKAESTTGEHAVVVSAMMHTTDHLLDALGQAAAGDFRAADRQVSKVGDVASSVAARVLKKTCAEDVRKTEVAEMTVEIGRYLEELRRLLYGISLLKEASDQVRDLVLSFGERMSARIVARLLSAVGVPSLYVDSRDWLVTDATFSRARVKWEATEARVKARAEQWSKVVSVHTGYIGATESGQTTTLGRNGSDYTAVLLGRALGAELVIISTDVQGVMTADPGLVEEAIPIPHLSYMEALELANFGSRMFHSKTMIPLIESGLPLLIQSTLDGAGGGTLIDREGDDDENTPVSVTSLENQSLVNVEWRSLYQQTRLGLRVLDALHQAGVTVWFATESAHGQALSFLVPRDEEARAVETVTESLEDLAEKGELSPIAVQSPVTLITLVAGAMGRRPNVVGRFTHTLGRQGVLLRAVGQGASARSVSVVIDAADTALAVRAAHDAFNFAEQEIHLLLVGHGVVGTELVHQIRSQAATLAAEHGVSVRVAGVLTRHKVLFERSGIDLENFEKDWESAPAPDGRGMQAYLDALAPQPVPVVVDCTASDELGSSYLDVLRRGIHIVGANKLPLVGELESYRELMAAVRKSHRSYHYETTVGAGLPVIETLKNLIRTGDHVRRIEGFFSGSLAFIIGRISSGMLLSEAVGEAHSSGYTEPRPQEDLGGLDVARKALILARELGMEVELENIELEPFVPPEFLDDCPPGDLVKRLEDLDSEYRDRVDRARERGKILSYLASIERGNGKPTIRVGLDEVDAGSPSATAAKGSAFVAFYTERYGEEPLLVQGAGAGGGVTAAGVLADILRVSLELRGR